MVKNGLQAIALNQRLALRSALWTQRGLTQLKALVLPAHATRRRDDSLELLGRVSVPMSAFTAWSAAR
jgi:hypothetical protein